MNLKHLCLIRYGLGTTLGSNCARKILQPQAVWTRFVARVSSEDPQHIADHPEPKLIQRKLHTLVRVSLQPRVNIRVLARISQSRVTPRSHPLSQTIVRLRSSLLNASSSVHRNGVTLVSRREWPHPRCSRNVRSKFSGELFLRNPFNAPVSDASSCESGGNNKNSKFQSSCAAACGRRSAHPHAMQDCNSTTKLALAGLPPPDRSGTQGRNIHRRASQYAHGHAPVCLRGRGVSPRRDSRPSARTFDATSIALSACPLLSK